MRLASIVLRSRSQAHDLNVTKLDLTVDPPNVDRVPNRDRRRAIAPSRQIHRGHVGPCVALACGQNGAAYCF